MALAGNIGATLEGVTDAFTAFGEDQARYIVTSHNPEAIEAAGIPVTRIGTTGGDALHMQAQQVTLSDLRTAHEGFFPALMDRSEEHTSELQSLMRISYAVFCLTQQTTKSHQTSSQHLPQVNPTLSQPDI